VLSEELTDERQTLTPQLEPGLVLGDEQFRSAKGRGQGIPPRSELAGRCVQPRDELS
jgi:hypothetical protein